MDPDSIRQLSAPKAELLEPPQSSKLTTASSYALRLGFIAMVWEQPFSVSSMKLVQPPARVREIVWLHDTVAESGYRDRLGDMQGTIIF